MRHQCPVGYAVELKVFIVVTVSDDELSVHQAQAA